jgi:hypothetical protein
MKSEKIVIDGYMFYPNDGEIEITENTLSHCDGSFTIRKDDMSGQSIGHLKNLFPQRKPAWMVYPQLMHIFISSIEEEATVDDFFITFYFFGRKK